MGASGHGWIGNLRAAAFVLPVCLGVSGAPGQDTPGVDARTLVEQAAQATGGGAAPEANAPDVRAQMEGIEQAMARGAGAFSCVLGVCPEARCGELEELGRVVIARSARAMATIDAGDERGAWEDADAERLLIARETVLPLRAARGALWLAACSPREADGRAWARRAAEIASRVDDLTVWSGVERSAVLGLALLLAGDGDGALRALREARQAVSERSPMGESGSLDLEIALGTIVALGMTGDAEGAFDLLESVTARAPFVDERGVRDWSLALLEADIAHRLGETMAARGAGERARVVERSVLRYAALAGANNVSVRDPRARRADVNERIRNIVSESGVGAERLPGIASSALAEAADLSDAGARARVVAMLERALDAMDEENDRFAPDVLFELGRALARAESAADWERSARILLRFAEVAPADDRVEAALGGACAVAGRVVRSGRDDGVYVVCLRAAVGHAGEVARADTWRLELARVLIDGMRGDVRADWSALLEASEALRAVTGDEARQTSAHLLVAMWLTVMEDVRAGELDQEWTERVAAAALSESDGAERLVRPDPLPGAAVLSGEALLALGRPAEAIERARGGEENARVARVRFEAMIELDRIAEAFAALDEAAARQPDRARAALERIEATEWAAIEAEVGGLPGGQASQRVQQVASVLERGVSWRVEQGIVPSLVERERAARALVFAGRGADAARVVRAGAAGEIVWADLLILMGEAYLLEREEAAGFDAYRRVATALEPTGTGTRPYWHAWTRMLEILQRRNRAGARSRDIRHEIGRLRDLDSWGDHPDCVARIESVGRAVGP